MEQKKINVANGTVLFKQSKKNQLRDAFIKALKKERLDS